MTDAALRVRFALFVSLLAAVFLGSFLIGRYDLSIGDMLYEFAGQTGLVPAAQTPAAVVLELRMPRVIGAVFVGAALSVSGAAYQFMFRNPMVSPGILGVSAGAGFGAALAILWGTPVWLLQGATFAGGMCAVAITYIVGVKLCRGGDTTLSIILSGIIVSTLFTSLLSMTKYLADPYDKLPAIVYWLMGSLAALTPDALPLPAALIAVGMIPLVLLRRRINVLSFGDETAQTLGVDVARALCRDRVRDAHDGDGRFCQRHRRDGRPCCAASGRLYRGRGFSPPAARLRAPRRAPPPARGRFLAQHLDDGAADRHSHLARRRAVLSLSLDPAPPPSLLNGGAVKFPAAAGFFYRCANLYKIERKKEEMLCVSV